MSVPLRTSVSIGTSIESLVNKNALSLENLISV